MDARDAECGKAGRVPDRGTRRPKSLLDAVPLSALDSGFRERRAAVRRVRIAPSRMSGGLLAPGSGRTCATPGRWPGPWAERHHKTKSYAAIGAVRTCVLRSRVARDNGIYRE